MLAVSALALVLLLAAAAPALAQSEAAHARKVVADVNQAIKSLRASSFTARRPDVEYTSDVKAWSDAGGVRKIEVTDRDDSGDVVTEYYYDQGALVFAYQAIKGFAESGRQVTRVEHRQYFRGGKMVLWLGGMERVPMAPGSAEFAREATTRLGASASYVKSAAGVRPESR